MTDIITPLETQLAAAIVALESDDAKQTATVTLDAATIASLQSTITSVKPWNKIMGLEYANLIQPGTEGSEGGTAPAHGTFSQVQGAGTGIALTVAPVYLVGKSDGFYFYRTVVSATVNPSLLASLATATEVLYGWEGCFTSPAGSAGCQALEWEFQMNPSGEFIINGANQYNRIDGVPANKCIRPFNYTGSQWLETSIPTNLTDFAPGTFMAVENHFLLDQVKRTCTHDYVIVNGVKSPINITQGFTPGTATANQLNIAFQLDSNNLNPTPTAYGFNLRKWYIMWR